MPVTSEASKRKQLWDALALEPIATSTEPGFGSMSSPDRGDGVPAFHLIPSLKFPLQQHGS